MSEELASWVGHRLGVRLVDAPGADSDDLVLADLAGLAVRRNPRRAHLVVSTVLGKHIPVDPRLSQPRFRDSLRTPRPRMPCPVAHRARG